MTANYKFVPLTDYENNIDSVADKHPNARSNTMGEVVISCNDGSGTHTHEDAMNHIESNWLTELGES